jgi:hypothetical protein
MSIRSKFLVHWTGRDIDSAIIDDDSRRNRYIERLRDDYVNGLFARRCEEGMLRRMKLKRLIRLCFTEIRLSEVQTHAGRYGKLGIGFDRKFLINRGARPVIYIPFLANDTFMEDTMAYVFNETTGAVHDRLKWLLAFVKRMSDKPTTHKSSQDFLEELEWRVVYGETLNPGDFLKQKDGTYRRAFDPKDVRLLVLPDEKAKVMALNDWVLKSFFSKHTPIMLILSDCQNF